MDNGKQGPVLSHLNFKHPRQVPTGCSDVRVNGISVLLHDCEGTPAKRFRLAALALERVQNARFQARSQGRIYYTHTAIGGLQPIPEAVMDKVTSYFPHIC